MFEIFIIQEPSTGSRDVPHKSWFPSVQPLWRLLDTNKLTNTQTIKQTNRHADKQSRDEDNYISSLQEWSEEL